MKCSICDEIIGKSDLFDDKKYSRIIELRQNIIFSTEHFVLLPSLGALNPSHVLIVPKKHYLSFSELPSEYEEELTFLKARLENYILSKKETHYSFFEHGTGEVQTTSGACVEHAHIHFLATPIEFDTFLKDQIAFLSLYDDMSLQKVADRFNGYVYYKGIDSLRFIKNNPNIQSQFFRYAYSKIDKNVEVWNWRSYTNINMIKKVLEFYKDFSQ